jgi:hypothetical protein
VDRVDGDVLTLLNANGDPEAVPFAYHWQLEGDELTFTRVPDQIGPTPWLINAWTRVED